MRKNLTIGVICTFLLNMLGPLPLAQADDFRLPAPGVMVHLSPEFNPPILKGLKVHPENPFRFDFILDPGDSLPLVGRAREGDLKQQSTRLIKYFLASLTIPEKDLWVNLSPYEKDRIIPNSFGLTEMGRDLLAEDYMLKQITASLIYPEDTIGKKFWKRIYAEAAKKFGTTNVPVNTFNKVWIVPDKAVVYENAKAGTAYVVESKLKVMLEQDYLSLQKHEGIQSDRTVGKDANQLGSQIVREIVIPQLTTEVNENKNFVNLRQVYNSLILASWYKKKIKDSILAQVYENKIAGVNIDNPQEKEKIYQRYLRAFKKGVFNYIKEEPFSPLDGSGRVVVPRKYFFGGTSFSDSAMKSAMVVTKDETVLGRVTQSLKQMLLNVFLSTIPNSQIGRKPDGTVKIYGYSFLSKRYVEQMERILSLCRPEDLKGLNITVLPFWHPMSVRPFLNRYQGFQYSKGIVVVAPLREQAFVELFVHELTHWLLRNNPEKESLLAEKIFDAKGHVIPESKVPSYYASVNKREYAAELAAFALTHKEDGDVITSQQRKILMQEVFNTTADEFYYRLGHANNTNFVSPLILSAMGHAWVVSLLTHEGWARYIQGYVAYILLVLVKLKLASKYQYKGQVITRSKPLEYVRARPYMRLVRFLATVCLITVFFSTPFRISIPEINFKKYKPVEMRIIRKEVSKEISLNNKPIEENPKDAKAYNDKGNALAAMGKLAEAREAYDEAIKLDPKNTLAYINKGNTLLAMGKPAEAKEALDKAIELDPKNVLAYMDKENALLAMGKLAEAKEALDKAIELDPKNALAYLRKSAVLASMAKLAEAKEAFDKAIELDPQITKNASTHIVKGGILMSTGKQAEAVEAYDEAIRLDSKNTLAYGGKGYALIAMGKFAEAIEALDKAIELDRKNILAYIGKAATLLAMGKQAEAKEAFDKAIEVDPKSAATFTTMGGILLDSGKEAEAREAFDKAIELDPKNVTTHLAIGAFFYATGKLPEAIKALDKVIELDPENAFAYNRKGVILKRMGMEQEAEKALQKEKELPSSKKDNAMMAHNPTGGIDLTIANMNLQIRNDAGKIKFHLDPAMLAQLQNAPGFVPVIINVQPLNSLSDFLGLNQDHPQRNLA